MLSNEQTKVVIIICGNEIRLDDREDEKVSRNPGMLLLLRMMFDLAMFATEIHSSLADAVDRSRPQSPGTRRCY